MVDQTEGTRKERTGQRHRFIIIIQYSDPRNVWKVSTWLLCMTVILKDNTGRWVVTYWLLSRAPIDLIALSEFMDYSNSSKGEYTFNGNLFDELWLLGSTCQRLV